MAAALLPGLIAYNLPPSPTLFNQAAALGLWGLAMAALVSPCTCSLRDATSRSASLVVPLLLVAVAALLSSAVGVLPWAMSTSAAGLLIAAAALAVAARRCGRPALDDGLLRRLGRRRRVQQRHRGGAGVRAGVGRWRLDRALRPGRPRGRQHAPTQPSSHAVAVVAVAVVPLIELGALGRTPARRAAAAACSR